MPSLTPLRKAWHAGRRAFRLDLAGRCVETRPDDTFLVSYPKSGNTWARFLVGNLLFPSKEISFRNLETTVPDIYQNTHHRLRRMPDPRILKSHEAFSPDYPRVVYIVRDPRDVVVSYFHYAQKMRAASGTEDIAGFWNDLLGGRVDGFGTWPEHVGSWLGARGEDPAFLLLRYEDMLADTSAAARSLAQFLDLGVDDATIDRAVSLSTFERMRALERRDAGKWRPARSSDQSKPFVRAGKQGGWRAELPSGVARQIENEWGETMRRLGYME